MASIAIDGPAGSGKSTIAKVLGEKLGMMYINTGSMYRAVTLFAIKNNIEATDIKGLEKLIESLDMHFDNEKLIVNGVDVTPELTMPQISNNVSNYAAVKEVRDLLVGQQAKMGETHSVIMDGRDIGTNVLKNAKHKFFLTADPRERANRRFKELVEKNIDVNYDTILSDIIKRDEIDSTRVESPLKKADDAIEIDTTKLSIEEVISTIERYIMEE